MKTLFVLILLLLIVGCSRQTNPRVLIATELGEVEAELYIDKAPVTAGNFLRYVDAGKYNDIACIYRVVRPDNQPGKNIKIEVIQGGFYTDAQVERNGFSPIRHETTRETGIHHRDGALSMARDQPGSASSEFFICIGAQPELDFGGMRNPDGHGFAAFGRIYKGMEVVRKIQQLKDSSQYLVHPVKIRSITRLKRN